jgi:hypothetical protein
MIVKNYFSAQKIMVSQQFFLLTPYQAPSILLLSPPPPKNTGKEF